MPRSKFIEFPLDDSLYNPTGLFQLHETVFDLQHSFQLVDRAMNVLSAERVEFNNQRARRDKAARRAEGTSESVHRDVEVAVLRLELVMDNIERLNAELESHIKRVHNYIKGAKSDSTSLAVAKNNVLVAEELRDEVCNSTHQLRLECLLRERNREPFGGIAAAYNKAPKNGRDFVLITVTAQGERNEQYPSYPPYLTMQEAFAYSLQGILPNGTRQKTEVINVSDRNRQS